MAMDDPLDDSISDPCDDRRIHRRISVRLPVELHGADETTRRAVHTISENVSTGGLYVQLDRCTFRAGDDVRVEMTVPPSEGVATAPGQASCIGRVVRIDSPGPNALHPDMRGVAIRFTEKLKLAF